MKSRFQPNDPAAVHRRFQEIQARALKRSEADTRKIQQLARQDSMKKAEGRRRARRFVI
jgi:hypothetical protein